MKKSKPIWAGLNYLVKVVGLAVVYHLAARLGLLMANVQPNTSPVWPPTGIAIAALLILGIKYWPGVTLGVLFGYLFNNNALNITLGLAVGNTLETVVAVYLLRRVLKFQNTLERIQDVVGLAVFGAVATTISATIGVITLLIFVSDIQPFLSTIWFTWWIGDLLGVLVIAPMILVWTTHFPARLGSKKQLEGLVVLLLLFLVTAYVFTNQTLGRVAHEAMIYVIFPFVIYAALRFTQLGAVNSMILVSGIAIYGTVVGSGPLVRQTLNESLILLQTFMGVVSLTALTLAATTSQRQKAEEALRQRVEDLGKLNDSSQTFLGIFDTKTIYQTVNQFAVEKFGLQASWIDLLDFGDRNPIAPYALNQKEIRALVGKMPKLERPKKETGLEIFSIAIGDKPGHLAYLPLKFGSRLIGQLALLTSDGQGFSGDRAILLTSYANLAAVAIQNTWLLDQVKSGNERLHALSHRLMEVQETEKLNLSRELHDESGQVISAMMVQLGLLERDAEKPEMIRKHAQELKHIAADVLSNLHDIAVRLRPASLDHLGLVKTLEQYISDFSRQHNLDVQFEAVGGMPKRVASEVETAIFRIVQESLTNVLLHANASRVDVILNQQKDVLNLMIEDNGVGFIPENVSSDSHLGLFGMRERVEMLGGRFSIESNLGKGTTIQVEVNDAH